MASVVSLFTGCGGSDLGLTQAGHEVIFANDILPYAKETYEKNFGRESREKYNLSDVREISNFPKSDILVGCYPCQGFSQGGNRDPSKTINYLYREFDRALRLIKPKVFIVENVSGMIRKNFFHLFNNQLVRFRLAGYHVSWQLINSADYGLPQERKRVFFIGIRSDLGVRYEFPKPTHGVTTKKSHVSQSKVLKGLPLWPEGEFHDTDFHWYYLSRDRYRSWDQPSKTIVSNPRNLQLHPQSPPLEKVKHNIWKFKYEAPARRLSYKEAALLQGFPRSFKFPNSVALNMKYNVIGNAVPPPIMRKLAESIPNIW